MRAEAKIVPTVENGLNVTCIAMWLRITWTWASCGGVLVQKQPRVKILVFIYFRLAVHIYSIQCIQFVDIYIHTL